MKDAGNDLNIVILDACRNNPFARSFRSTVKGLAKMDAPKGSIIAYATSPGELAADGDGKNGIYTKHLIRNIKKPGLSVEQVFKNVRIAVATETANKQIPWESSSLMGSFSFDPNQQSSKQDPTSIVNQQPATNSHEIVFWNSIKDSSNSDTFRDYLEQFPSGLFASLAKIKLRELSVSKKSTSNISVPKQVEAEPKNQSQSKETISLASIDPEMNDPDDIVAQDLDGRFVKYRNGIVTDNKTGYDWLAGPVTTNVYEGAKRWMDTLNLDGGGWRMPSKKELRALYQKGVGQKNITFLLEAKAWHIYSRDSSNSLLTGFNFKSSREFSFRIDIGRYDGGYPLVAFQAFAVRKK